MTPDEKIPGRLYLLEGDERLPFDPPFRCMCCGNEISERQWRFSCLCGPCDIGACQNDDTQFTHAQPEWMRAGDRMAVHRAYSAACTRREAE